MYKLYFLLCCSMLYFGLKAQKDIQIEDSRKIILEAYQLQQNKEYQKAIEQYNLVHKNDTNYLLSQYEKALSLNALEKHEQCIRICEDFLSNKYNKGHTIEINVYNLLGAAYNDSKNTKASLKIYDEGLKKYPKYTSFKLNKAISLKQAEKYEESLETIKKLLLENHHHANAHFHLGLYAAQEGKSTQALLSFYLSTISALNFEKLVFLDNYAQGDLTPEPKNLKLNKNSTADSFAEIDLIVQNKVALSKNYKTPSNFSFPFVKQLYAILDLLEYDKNDKGFWMQYYVPYFIALKEEKQIENLIYFLMGLSTDENISKKIQKHLPDIKSFYNWHLSKWNELHATKEASIMGQKDLYTHYFDKQVLTAIGNNNEKGEPIGPWQYYYSNGSLLSYGMQKDGKRDGVWHFYNKNGSIDAIYNYKENLLNGEYKVYDEQGSLEQSGYYKNQKLQGKVSNYFKDGTLSKEYVYNEGIRTELGIDYYENGERRFLIQFDESNNIHGEIKSYYPSGELESIMQWKNGKRNGPSINYFNHGDTSTIENYKEHNLDGEYIKYYSNKQLNLIGHFKDGKEIGESLDYYKNGHLHTKNNFDENGKKNGTIAGYSPNGHKVYKYIYNKGELIGYLHFDKNGNVIREEKAKNGQLNYKYIYDNNQIKTAGLLVKNKNEGLWKYYNKNGTLSSESNYKNGLRNGSTKNYYPNGQIKNETNYKDNLFDKQYSAYYKDGTIHKKGNYTLGKAQGEWIFYYENGVISAIKYYLNDQEHGIQESFNIKGVLQETVLYDRGMLLERYSYNQKEEPIDTHIYNNGTLDIVYKNVMGHPIRKGKIQNGKPEGKHLFYYGPNQLQTQANFILGKRHGEWNWYENNQLITKAHYIHGELHGKYYHYYPNNKIKSEFVYDYDNPTGTWKYYYDNGQLRRDMSHQNHARHGKSHYYTPNGKLQYVKIHDNGYFVGYTYLDKDGKLKETIPAHNEKVHIEAYFPNGNKSAELEIKNDTHFGDVKMYYENGQLESINPHQNGYNHGWYKQYFEDGTLKQETSYSKDSKNGKEKYYYSNGKLKQETNYIHGIKFGIAYYYNELGLKTKEIEFYDNQIINETIF